jgi:UDP-N-acetyl-D-galactosamine dehydrogenase
LIVGFTFKENVPDIRNSGVIGIVTTLREYGIDVSVWDPEANSADVEHEYGLALSPLDKQARYDALVFAVAHRGCAELVLELCAGARIPVLIDVKGAVPRERVPAGVSYWRL